MPVTRKLAAIFYADVAGYSRLTTMDEEGTHVRVMAMLDMATAAIEASNGSVLRYAGDAILASFPSVVEAMRTSVQIQGALAARNEGLPEPEKLCIRIGVNLGDVIEDRGEVYGDGVNIAARLEAASVPGGICLSAAVKEQLGGKVDLPLHDGGKVVLKNIEQPVRLYHWTPDGTKPASKASRREPVKKPAIAVLPFDAMSPDPDQGFFADGLTEDLITALSKNQWYEVTARNSTFAYKGTAHDIRRIGEALGVGFVLEGSVRKGGSRVRITVQLINAVSGTHEWAEKFDRQLKDVFEVQDEITTRVVTILSERIWQSVATEIRDKTPGEYGPYEWVYSAIALVHQIEPDSIETAKRYCIKALEFDADLVPAHLGLGFSYFIDWVFMGDMDGGALAKAEHHARRLHELSPGDAHAYRLLSRIYLATGKLEEAKRCVEKAVGLNAFDGDMLLNKGLYVLYAESAEQSMVWFDRVLEMHDETPHTVDIARMWKALAYFAMEDYGGAVTQMKNITNLPYLRALIGAACLVQLGEEDSARTAAKAALGARPGLRVSNLGLCRMFQDAEVRTRLSTALSMAGVPA
jgi:TolB-like protein/Flp pilus assembly protein TadD